MSKEYKMTEGEIEFANALDHVVRLATRNKIVIAGFAVGSEHPFLSAFSNTRDSLDKNLYIKFIEIVKEKKRAGHFVAVTVDEVN
jgi:hypothetical protein